MRRSLISITLAAALAMPTMAQDAPAKLSKPEREAMALTAEEASLRTLVRGTDALDPGVWVSTEPFLKGNADDKFFRALIDKETGKTTYQLYLRSTSSRGPLRLSRMTYLIDGKLKTVPIERLDTDVSCRGYGCTYFEDAIAELPREDLEALSASSGDSDYSWRMRLFGEAVTGIDTASLHNETAGFLIAVDRERKRLGFD
ncbi:hypothetical protein [Sphingopyxis sp. GW247-27LB]|uniref:hypothetical protein n=1 Tax=Sphingopyxis sp. GW247-27LB TaxID=2012632 RepID=UPI000BA6074A|nr:hypothetical protein [Sphingopyxis sp. GW247-27LB]PAL20184.1 hypothetical protein CD928_17395 [Sphingopyxis sp. GW247-27LB]